MATPQTLQETASTSGCWLGPLAMGDVSSEEQFVYAHRCTGTNRTPVRGVDIPLMAAEGAKGTQFSCFASWKDQNPGIRWHLKA